MDARRMDARRAMPVAFLTGLALCGGAPGASSDTPAAASARLGDLRAVGTVKLRSSGGPEAQAGIERATALLHSFFYDEARRHFAEVAAGEPDCALAQWGVAMTLWHPIWSPPSPEERAA